MHRPAVSKILTNTPNLRLKIVRSKYTTYDCSSNVLEITVPSCFRKLLIVFCKWKYTYVTCFEDLLLQWEQTGLTQSATGGQGSQRVLRDRLTHCWIWSFYGICWQLGKYRILATLFLNWQVIFSNLKSWSVWKKFVCLKKWCGFCFFLWALYNSISVFIFSLAPVGFSGVSAMPFLPELYRTALKTTWCQWYRCLCCDCVPTGSG